MSRIYLRAIEPADYTLTHLWRQDDATMNAIGGNRNFISIEREKTWTHQKSIDDSNGIYLAICLKDTDLMIGYCSIIHIDLRNLKADLGGTIIGDLAHRGKGYGKDAQMLMLKYCFEELPLHKVYGYCLDKHEVTKRMMTSLGFQQDGIIRDDLYKNGQFHSIVLFSILRNEYIDKYVSESNLSVLKAL